jgi:preprotein translocase subunit SecE
LQVRILPGLPYLLKRQEAEAVEKFLDFTREARAELRKVTWPGRQQVWYSTLVVIALTLLTSAVLGVMDVLLTFVFKAVIR